MISDELYSYSFLLCPKITTATSTEQSTDNSCAFLNSPPLRLRNVTLRFRSSRLYHGSIRVTGGGRVAKDHTRYGTYIGLICKAQCQYEGKASVEECARANKREDSTYLNLPATHDDYESKLVRAPGAAQTVINGRPCRWGGDVVGGVRRCWPSVHVKKDRALLQGSRPGGEDKISAQERRKQTSEVSRRGARARVDRLEEG